MTEIKHFNVRVYGLLIDKDKNILVSDEEDIRQNPNGNEIVERLERIMAKIPVSD